MAWLRKSSPELEHVCEPPMRDVMIPSPPPLTCDETWRRHKIGVCADGQVGDVWRCDYCECLWVVTDNDRFRIHPDGSISCGWDMSWPRWEHADLMTRFWYRDHH